MAYWKSGSCESGGSGVLSGTVVFLGAVAFSGTAGAAGSGFGDCSEADRELTFPPDEDEGAGDEGDQGPGHALHEPGPLRRRVVDEGVVPGPDHRSQRVEADRACPQTVRGQAAQVEQH